MVARNPSMCDVRLRSLELYFRVKKKAGVSVDTTATGTTWPAWSRENVGQRSWTFSLGILLVTFLLLWEDPVAKGSLRKKELILPYGFRGIEMEGSIAQEHRASWSQFYSPTRTRESNQEERWGYKPSKPTPSNVLPPLSFHLLKIP